jgi:hypothetical protein
MKQILSFTSVLALAVLAAGATPLDKTRISAEAKWMLHLDADRLKSTQIGEFILSQILEPKSAKVKQDLQRELDFNLDWRKIRALTAYGSTYQKDDPSGLLIIDSGLEFAPALETAIQRDRPGLRVEKLQSDPYPLYYLNQDAYVAVLKGGLLLISKSRPVIEYGQAVIAGHKPNLGAADTLKPYPEAPNGFFFLALANDFARLAKLPPKAAVLKQAEGGRIVLGEQDGKLRLNLDIRARSDDIARQIRQVAEGLVGLAALQAEQHPDLHALADTANVSTTGPLVTLGLQFPVPDAIKKLADKYKSDK